MFRAIFILLIFSITNSICIKSLFAQGELDTEAKKLVFKNEKTFAFLLNSNGFGGNYRYAKRLDGFSKRLYDIEINTVKHPKETKTQNPYFDTNQRRYVFGKTNSFMNLRLALGKQKEIFSKFDKGGIAIIYFYSAGPVIGFLKPIYYEVLYPVDSSPYDYVIRTEKFNTSIHRVGDIYGKAPFSVGTNEIKIIPGFYTKFGISFEYGKSDKVVHSIDVGASIEAYTQKIIMMATEENSQILVSLFASYRFGKAVSKRLKNIENY